MSFVESGAAQNFCAGRGNKNLCLHISKIMGSLEEILNKRKYRKVGRGEGACVQHHKQECQV